MSQDIKDWVLELIGKRDDKILTLIQLTSEQRMALKILGISLGILATGVITALLKSWGLI